MAEPAKLPDGMIVKTAIQLAVTLVIMAALLFWPAGTLAWPAAWWLLVVFAVLVVAAVVYVAQVNPELFAARQRFQPGTKPLDVVVASVSVIAIAAILPVAGFDVRFGWSAVPAWLVAVGYVLFVLGFVVAIWAESVNRHFELGVRIQTDRGHTVIDTGPYARVRHPGYIGAIAMCIGLALALGSYVALVPAVIVIGLLAFRTIEEEQTLRAELPGYAEYTARVRHRWVPGVW
jgi:protein-S-isoprenylcysteine O-methyltransferase Ste14